MSRPAVRPRGAAFSSGPCRKPPQWRFADLQSALLGRSHRSAGAKARLQAVIEESRDLLGIPTDYRIAITPGSDTGAVEMALWSLLGPRGVDVLAWENFSADWVIDVLESLRLPGARVFKADYGRLPDLSQVDWDRDVVFPWNGTSSGVCVPNGDWIDPQRRGLSICDATSAAFAMDLPWDRLDATTWSWQKCLGGEAAHGMLALSPRAVARLESYTPSWPMPKLFRLMKKGVLNEGIFCGETINTPSMLCVEDVLGALRWAREIGGLPALQRRTRESLRLIEDWQQRTPWIDFLCQDPAHRSSTSICLTLSQRASVADDATAPKRMAALLEQEVVAFDINAYRTAPPGLRLWGGPTVDPEDLAALTPWLEWAYRQIGGGLR